LGNNVKFVHDHIQLLPGKEILKFRR